VPLLKDFVTYGLFVLNGIMLIILKKINIKNLTIRVSRSVLMMILSDHVVTLILWDWIVSEGPIPT